MNYKLTFPNKIDFKVDLPASKSICNRGLVLNSLSGNTQEVKNLAKCDDTDVMLAALQSKSDNVNIGAAGTSMRFLIGYYSIQNWDTTIIDGRERLRQRPIMFPVDALRYCGPNIIFVII